MGVVGRGVPAAHGGQAREHRLLGRRRRRGHHQAVLVLVVHGREVVPLPVADRTGAVEVQDEDDLLVWLQGAGVVEDEFAAGLGVDRIAQLGQRAARGALRPAAAGRRRVGAGHARHVLGHGRPGGQRGGRAERQKPGLHLGLHPGIPLEGPI